MGAKKFDRINKILFQCLLVVTAIGLVMGGGAYLLGEPLLLREEGSGTRVILEYYLKEHGLAAADFARTVEIGNIGAIKTLLKSGYGVSFLYRAAIRPEEAAGALGVIELSDFELRHDIMFLFPKNSNFRADYTTIFRELRACAEETGGA